MTDRELVHEVWREAAAGLRLAEAVVAVGAGRDVLRWLRGQTPTPATTFRYEDEYVD